MEISDLHTKKKVMAAFVDFPTFRNKELMENGLIVVPELEDEFSTVVVKRIKVNVFEGIKGYETITVDGLPDEERKNLDEKCIIHEVENGKIRIVSKPGGIVKRGAYVKKGDILVRKLYDERDTSARWPYEDGGVIIDTKYFPNHTVLIDAIIKRKLRIGDVLRDAAGNKGVVVKFSPIGSGRYKGDKIKIEVLGTYNCDLISSLEEPEEKNVWARGNWLLFYAPRIKKKEQIQYLQHKKEYQLLGKAKIGVLTLEKITQQEEKISVRSSGPYSIIDGRPLIFDPITRFEYGATVTAKELSALKEYPELTKEIFLKSDRKTVRSLK
jgi:hypothetical protein